MINSGTGKENRQQRYEHIRVALDPSYSGVGGEQVALGRAIKMKLSLLRFFGRYCALLRLPSSSAGGAE